MKASIAALVIDDDQRLTALLSEYLGQNDIAVTICHDGERGLKAAQGSDFDVVLLDLMLPGIDGLEVCRRLRERAPKLPILMLTAKGDDVDKIVGLELGADDYLAKPFNPRELLARIKAVLRRSRGAQEAPELLSIGELRLDLSAREVRVGQRRVVLTSFEFEMLACLARARGRVLSREQIFDALKGEEFDAFDRSVDVHISKLRAKLEADPKAPRYIKTIRGVGYVLSDGG